MERQDLLYSQYIVMFINMLDWAPYASIKGVKTTQDLVVKTTEPVLLTATPLKVIGEVLSSTLCFFIYLIHVLSTYLSMQH